MAERSVTRRDLTEAIYLKAGLSRSESTAFVELVLKEIANALDKGETVRLWSSGPFMIRKKGRRIGRNTKTGAEVTTSPRGVMVFESSGALHGDAQSRETDAADKEALESETQIAALIETIAGALKSTASELSAINDRIEKIVSTQAAAPRASIAGGSLGSAE